MPENISKSTVYVDVEDDISTIIEKMEDAPQKIVAFVLPKRSAVLQSTVNMRLLKKSAEAAGKKIALVTSDSALLPLAAAVGLPVAKNLESAPEMPVADDLSAANNALPAPLAEKPVTPEKAAKTDSKPIPIRGDASVGALAEANQRKEPETVELESEDTASGGQTAKAGTGLAAMSKLPKIRVPNFERFRLWSVLGIGGFLVLIIFLILATKVLPKASINISTSSTPVSLNMNITTSGKAKSLDKTNGILPSSLQTYKQSAKKTVTATGQQNQGSKATGSVTISTPCSPQVPNMPAGTTLTSADSLNYVTESAASFSPGISHGSCVYTSNSIDIIAAQPGNNYNGATSYTVSGYSDASASGAATTGGTNKIVTVVSQQDLSTAVTALSGTDASKPSKDDVTKTFESQLDSQGYYLIASTLKVSDPTPSATPAVGQQASSAVVTVTTTYTVLAVKKDDLTKLITDYANKQIDTSKQKVDLTDVLKKATIEVASQSSPTDAALTVGGTVNAVPILDTNAIKQAAAGKKKGDIISQISNYPGVKSVDVHLSPFWVTVVPKPGKTTVNIQASGSN